ncbi:hypothetical protein [Hymenobacter metallicola]|uniref:Uncharacterized protein n=1 Tax=Hymenobacter metallicola TaxID=2563114 RepID=A0A4Z0Q0G2_9BACT|nr:hypothetical protein [Hymenobacter metallicola]TGE23518.1 hypothetical protein E5K02_20235 [Hymenobacter metallicola]
MAVAVGAFVCVNANNMVILIEKPTMFRSAATYISFLIATSLIYYIIYWSLFDIDIFQFIEVNDLPKGLVFPLRHTILYSIGLAFFATAINTWLYHKTPIDIFKKANEKVSQMRVDIDSKSEQELEEISAKLKDIESNIKRANTEFRDNNKLLVIIGSLSTPFITASLIGSLILFSMYPWEPSMALCTSTFLTIVITLVLEHQNILPDNMLSLSLSNKGHIFAIDFIVRFFIVFLPINAAIVAYSDASSILQSKRFKYIISNDIGDKIDKTHSHYIYLGNAGDNIVLTNQKFTDKIIIKISDVNLLRFRTFNIENDSSVKYFIRLSVAPVKKAEQKAHHQEQMQAEPQGPR